MAMVWKVVVTWVRRVEFPMWPVWMWAQSVFVVRWTRGRRAREGSSHRTGWRAILGIPLSLAAISSTPPWYIWFPFRVLVAQVSAGSSVVDGVNMVNPVLSRRLGAGLLSMPESLLPDPST